MSAQLKRVLLVDDDRICRMAHHIPLVEAGYLVDEAENGHQAIEKFVTNKGRYDMILMDYNMPDMNGADITKTLRLLENNKTPTVIIGITSQTDPVVTSACLASGMNEILTKPILPVALDNMLKRYST